MKARKLMLFHCLPILVVLLPFIWYGVVGNDKWIGGEGGIVENLTVLFLVLAIAICVSGIILANRRRLSSMVKFWMVIMILGSGYFALEEISYGQHLFGWSATDTWKELNDQDETNLHNIHAVFDQIPRALLTIGILVGGVVLPLYRYFRGIQLNRSDRFYWQWPTLDCVTIGLLVLLIRPVLSIIDVDFVTTGELKETLFALFILLYCVSLRTRIKREVPVTTTTGQSPG